MPLTNAEKQAAFRARRDAELEALREQTAALIDALAGAAERGRSPRLTNHLPANTWDAAAELVRRLEGNRIILCGPER